MSSLPVAHAGHWIADSLYAVPIVVLALALWIQSMRDKRRDDSEEESDEKRRNL